MRRWMIVSMLMSALLGACVVTPVGYRSYDDGYYARRDHHYYYRDYPYRGHYYRGDYYYYGR